ncbi:MAG TPA: HEAT repeat domain-containing protein [Vicinamibacterales bacterium]|nr:HEAT repeat domain-containing protein [Vicinamibacterales bacterium]
MRRMLAAGLVLAAAIPLAAQSPVINAVVEKRTPSADFARDVQAIAGRTTPAWIGYRVPIQRRSDASMQGFESCCGRCRLAPPTDLVVLARVQGAAILELRPIAVDCDMDAGGMPLFWFDGVSADASVAWLSTLVTQTGDARRLADRALSAISQHAGSAAVTALVRFATGTSEIRGRALSWLAERAADQALPAINATLQKDPDTEMKKQAVRALSRFPNNEGIPKLMEVARSHDNAEVRRQAMLQLGQSRDPRVVDFFSQILLR